MSLVFLFESIWKMPSIIIFSNVSKVTVHQEGTFAPPPFHIFQGTSIFWLACIKAVSRVHCCSEDKLSRIKDGLSKTKCVWRGIKVLLKEESVCRKWYFRLFGVVWPGDEMNLAEVSGETLMGKGMELLLHIWDWWIWQLWSESQKINHAAAVAWLVFIWMLTSFPSAALFKQ